MADLSPLGLQQSTNMGDSSSLVLRKDSDKHQVPQWGYNETKKFIEIRAEFEKDFVATKRNKTLWELISAKMKEHSYRRSADQCKCKWKNLVNRYKGKETSEVESGRQCPFFDELDAIFKERAKNMDRLLLESEGGGHVKKKGKRGRKSVSNGQKMGDEESDDYEDDDDDEDFSEEEKVMRKRARRVEKERQKLVGDKSKTLQEMLEDFFKYQQRLELEWREAVEQREAERGMREAEFRDAMLRLEQERALREAEWRERDEQRRMREEARSEKRDQLLEALINKLVQE